MRPHKLAITLVLLRAVRAAQITAVIAGVLAYGRSHPRVVTEPPIPADTTPMLVPTTVATTTYDPPPPPLEPRTLDGRLDDVSLFGDVAWGTVTLDSRTGVVRSTDGGATWTPVGPRVYDSCGFFAHDANDAFFTLCDQESDGQTALSTTHDGGKSWTYEVVSESRGSSTTITFQDATTGTLVVSPYSYAEGTPDIRTFLYRTHDGGRSWTHVSDPGGSDVTFSDADHAFTLGDQDGNGEMLRWSMDGGKTFDVHPAFRACSVKDDPVFEGARGLLVALCPAGAFVFTTIDAGISWTAGNRIERGENIGWMDFTDLRRGVFVEPDKMHFTNDGGATWKDMPHPESGVWWSKDSVFSTIDSDTTTVLRDGRKVATMSSHAAVSFASSGRTVLVIGSSDEGSVVYRSRDGGDSFTLLAR